MERENDIEKCFKMQQKLIETANSFWNQKWSWTVTKQEIDYGDEKDNTMEVAVATFVRIVDNLGMQRENMGYSFTSSTEKGLAFCIARKVSIVNALLETLHSFGGELSKKLNTLELNVCTNVVSNKTQSGLSSKHNERQEQKAFNDNKNDNQKTYASPVNQGNYSNSSNSTSRSTNPIHAVVAGSRSQELIPNQNNNSAHGKSRKIGQVIAPVNIPTAITSSNDGPTTRSRLSNNSTNTFPTGQQPPGGFGVPPPNPVPVAMPPAPPGPQISRQISNNDAQKPVKKTEEEMRAERKRRQKEKQAEFQKQLQAKMTNASTNNALGIRNDDENYLTSDDPSFAISTQDLNTMISGVRSEIPSWVTAKLKRPSSDDRVTEEFNKMKKLGVP